MLKFLNHFRFCDKHLDHFSGVFLDYSPFHVLFSSVLGGIMGFVIYSLVDGILFSEISGIDFDIRLFMFRLVMWGSQK